MTVLPGFDRPSTVARVGPVDDAPCSKGGGASAGASAAATTTTAARAGPRPAPGPAVQRRAGGALESLAERVPLPVTVVALPEQRLPQPLEVAAYYVVGEALTNAVKHADASAATVRIQQRDGAVHIKVTDDGRGGTVPAGPGLQGLADRLAALGDRLELHSPPEKGATLAAHLPAAVTWPLPIDHRLGQLVERANEAGAGTSRTELLAAIVADTTANAHELLQLVVQWRRSSVRDVVLGVNGGRHYLPASLRPGRRRKGAAGLRRHGRHDRVSCGV